MYVIKVLIMNSSAYCVFKTIDLKSTFIFVNANNYSVISY
nr:MAG TPA: hypothetical protein [Bacteriophage sp.]